MELLLRKYAALWNKYRPVILKMMVDASREAQQYKLMAHEVSAADDKKKGGFSFSLHVSGGKAVNNIKTSEIAQDLLHMLSLSPKGTELLANGTYEFSLDRQFVLHVSQPQAAEVPATEA